MQIEFVQEMKKFCERYFDSEIEVGRDGFARGTGNSRNLYNLTRIHATLNRINKNKMFKTYNQKN